MRILLDESLPRDLAALLAPHDVSTVQAAGWSGVKNGELLVLAAGAFDFFVTADQNLEFQQNLASLPIAVVVLVLNRNRIQDIEPLVPALLESLATTQPRTLVRIGS